MLLNVSVDSSCTVVGCVPSLRSGRSSIAIISSLETVVFSFVFENVTKFFLFTVASSVVFSSSVAELEDIHVYGRC